MACRDRRMAKATRECAHIAHVHARVGSAASRRRRPGLLAIADDPSSTDRTAGITLRSNSATTEPSSPGRPARPFHTDSSGGSTAYRSGGSAEPISGRSEETSRHRRRGRSPSCSGPTADRHDQGTLSGRHPKARGGRLHPYARRERDASCPALSTRHRPMHRHRSPGMVGRHDSRVRTHARSGRLRS
jgi:hypothetical protein